jgi:hypothetical protein
VTDNDLAMLIACFQVFLFGVGVGFGAVMAWYLVTWRRGK